jgi:hypothetical protein
MPVTFAVTDDPRDILIAAVAEHTMRQGEPVRCYTTPDGTTRARRSLPGEKPLGEALHDAACGMPVTVLVLRRGERTAAD